MVFELINHYDSGPSSELVWQIPMTEWSPYIHKIAYQIKIKDLQIGDIVQCHGQGEITSEHYYNIMVCCYIVLTEEKEEVDGLFVTRPYGGNIDRNEHHRPIITNGIAIIDKNTYQYASFIVYSASTSAKLGDFIILEPNYGRFYILIFREKYG